MASAKGSIVVRTEENLLKMIKKVLPKRTVLIVGEAGTGKTVLVENMKGQKIGFTENSPVIDEVVVLRLGAMSSEDFIIPFVKEREIVKDGHKLKEKVVETAELSIFKAAKDNPHKNYLLFLDEVNRVSHDMQKILFSLAEQKTPQGEHLPNIYVIAAINHGDAYDLDIEISDIALKRRFAFIEFSPEVDNFKTDKSHRLIQEIKPYLTRTDDIIDTNLKDADKVFEQATTYGSYASYSSYLEELEAELTIKTGKDNFKLSYEEAANDMVTTAGPLYFKGETANKIADIYFMLENTKSFDFEQIIEDGKVDKNKWGDGKYSENDIVTRTYYAIREKILTDISFLNKKRGTGAKVKTNGVNLLSFMVANKKTNLYMALMKDIN